MSQKANTVIAVSAYISASFVPLVGSLCPGRTRVAADVVASATSCLVDKIRTSTNSRTIDQEWEENHVEPPRVRWRPFGLSHAAMAGCSSMA